MKLKSLARALVLAGLSEASRPFRTLTQTEWDNLIEIPILSPVPLSGGWIGGHTMRVTAEIAMDIMNSQQLILPGYKITTKWLDDQCNRKVAPKIVLSEWYNNENWVALGAGGCSAVCADTAALTPSLRIPHVSYGCAAGFLNNQENYPYFQRFMLPESAMADVFKALAIQLGWTDMTIITGDPDRFDGPAQDLLDYFDGDSSGLNVEWIYPRNPTWEQTLTMASLLKREYRRVIVVLGYEPFYRRVVCASKVALIPKGVVWLSVGWHKTGWWTETDTTMTDLEPTCTPSAISEYVNGAIGAAGLGKPIGTDLDAPLACLDGYSSKSFVEAATPYFKDGYPVGDNIIPGDAYSGILGNGPDGICLFAKMIKHMLGKGKALADLSRPTEADYLDMIDYIKNVSDFTGVGGRIAFAGQNSNAGIMKITQVQSGNKETVGTLDVQGSLEWSKSLVWGDGETAPKSFFPFCAEGTIQQADGTCEACPAGTYYGKTSEQCISCDPGKFIASAGAIGKEEDDDTCKVCPDGTYAENQSSAVCDACPSGTRSVAGDFSYCSLCEPGTFAEGTGNSECSKCAPGSYADQSRVSACTKCGAGKSGQNWATMQKIQGEWVLMEGAVQVESCGCEEGTYPDEGGECVPCEEGITCPGMGEVVLDQGYFSTHDRPGFVFKCHGSDFKRCPGGQPGTCATNRKNASVACTRCNENTKPSSDGSCTDCSAGEVFPFIALGLAVFGGLAGMYYAIDTENHAKQSQAALLMIIASGQLITLAQQQGVVSTISIAWPEPFASVQRIVTLLNFNIDVLNVNCVAPVDPITRYAMRVFLVILFFMVMVMIHFGFVFGRFFKNRGAGTIQWRFASLVGATGTIFMAFFISIVSSMLEPFKCTPHPNGLRTLKGYPEVVCSYGSGDHPYHSEMMFIGLFANLIPMSFFVTCVVVVLLLPRRLKKGDTGFLHSFAFLFFRFRPEQHWYVLVFLVRNLLIAFTPVLPDSVTQIIFLQTILLPSLVVLVYTVPWRVWRANVLDMILSVMLIWILFLASFCTIDDEMPTTSIAILCCVLFTIAVFGIFVAFSFGVYEKIVRTGKPFGFFICHHKAGAGNFARLLKMQLMEHQHVRKAVFIDSDNLADLTKLFDYVGYQTDTILVLLSKDILTRPWCMGEVTSARLNEISMIGIIMPDFAWPEKDFLDNYENHVPEVKELLSGYGINVSDVHDSIKQLETCYQVSVPNRVNAVIVEDLVTKLVARHTQSRKFKLKDADDDDRIPEACNETVPSQSSEKGSGSWKTTIIVDHENLEAASAACVLQKLLAVQNRTDSADVPMVLDRGGKLTNTTKQIIVVCTTGCFQTGALIKIILKASELNVRALPVICEPNFRVPTADLMDSVRSDSKMLSDAQVDRGEYTVFSQVIQKLFTEIATDLNCHEAEKLLHLRANLIQQRLEGPLKMLGLSAGQQ